jgi:hypothetical protein
MNDVLNIPENYNAMRGRHRRDAQGRPRGYRPERQFNYDRGILGNRATNCSFRTARESRAEYGQQLIAQLAVI